MTSSRSAPLAEELREIVGIEGVLAAQSDLLVFECDGYQIEKNSPDMAVFPRTTDDVARIVRAAATGRDVPSFPAGRARVWPAACCRSAAA